MKIRSFPCAILPLAFAIAFPWSGSAQVVVWGGFHGGWGHPYPSAPAPCHQPVGGCYPYATYGYCHSPVWVGPQQVIYSSGGFTSGYYSNGGYFGGTPGVTVVRTGSRGPFRSTGFYSNAVDSGFGAAPSFAPALPAKSAPEAWIDAGEPVGGPVGTWYETAPTPGNVLQYTVHADGTYETSEFRKTASGPMPLVAEGTPRIPFTFRDGVLVLDPDGTRREGPFAVSMSANSLGQTRVTLKDPQTGRVRVWRSTH